MWDLIVKNFMRVTEGMMYSYDDKFCQKIDTVIGQDESVQDS